MIKGFIRYALYATVLYNIYNINSWIAFAFGVVFGLFEIVWHMFELISKDFEVCNQAFMLLDERSLLMHTYMVNLQQQFDGGAGFKFSGEPLSPYEEGMLESIKAGDDETITEFLSGRCENKQVDFHSAMFPVRLKAFLANKIVEALESTDLNSEWDELFEE